MLSHQAYNALIGWEALGPRIMHTSFKTRMEKIQLNIIQCYAPTNDKDEGTKKDFYNKLQTVLDKMREKDGRFHGRFQCKDSIKQQRI